MSLGDTINDVRRLNAEAAGFRKQQLKGGGAWGASFANSQATTYRPWRTRHGPPAQSSGMQLDVWDPVFGTIQFGDQTVEALSCINNCVLMAGREFYDFGTLTPRDNEYLSGAVFAVFAHPLWAGEYFSLSCFLSSAPKLDAARQFSENYTIMPLYYVAPNGLSVDYRAMPTITMYQ